MNLTKPDRCIWDATGPGKYFGRCRERTMGIPAKWSGLVKYCPHCGAQIEYRWIGNGGMNREQRHRRWGIRITWGPSQHERANAETSKKP
jgi:hypothetical protein